MQFQEDILQRSLDDVLNIATSRNQTNLAGFLGSILAKKDADGIMDLLTKKETSYEYKEDSIKYVLTYGLFLKHNYVGDKMQEFGEDIINRVYTLILEILDNKPLSIQLHDDYKSYNEYETACDLEERIFSLRLLCSTRLNHVGNTLLTNYSQYTTKTFEERLLDLIRSEF